VHHTRVICGMIYNDILQQSYGNLTMMPQLRSTYIDLLFCITSYGECKPFLGVICLQYRKILSEGVRKLAYDISNRNRSTLSLS